MDSSQIGIADWYSGQNVFITGATGFMGKILIEKLLRCCPDVQNVYMLIRPKSGKSVEQRREEILKCPIFQNLLHHHNYKTILSKLKCIEGDVSRANCGLSDDNFNFLKESITTVFHMAANVRFDQTLKEAVVMNIGGTLNVLELVKTFKNLKIHVHVSTSYCHCNVKVLEEKLYDPPQDPRKMLDLVKWMDEKLLEFLTAELLKDFPNTYAYTKGLTEKLVSEYSQNIPIVIARPSIVVAAYKEPIPGWVDSINGPTGLMIAAGKGVIRTMHCNTELLADVVPVDMVINSLLIVAYDVGRKNKVDETEVYHITIDRKCGLTWGEALELGRKYFFEYPFSVCMWYPRGSLKSNYFVHSVTAFFLHLIPAYLIDFILGFTSHKPFMVKLQKRIQHGLGMLQYYTTREWNFRNEKLYKTFDALDPKDREVFYIYRNKVDMDQFMLNYILGARKYCVKEGEETLPYARKLLKRLYYLDLMTNALLIGLLLWISYLFIAMFNVD